MAETRKYLHVEPFKFIASVYTEDGLTGRRLLHEELIPHNDSEILVVQCQSITKGKDGFLFYTVVPGTVIEYKTGDNGDGVPVSKVKPIEEKDRSDLEKILIEKGFKGPINFWEESYKTGDLGRKLLEVQLE